MRFLFHTHGKSESERTVDAFQQAFAQRGIRVVRDKKELDYKGSIEAFEQRIPPGAVRHSGN